MQLKALEYYDKIKEERLRIENDKDKNQKMFNCITEMKNNENSPYHNNSNQGNQSGNSSYLNSYGNFNKYHNR